MIDIQNLWFGYGRQALFESFDLRIASPGLHGLFGRNGSGKSTLFKLMSGLLFRKGGRIDVRGWNPERRHADFLADIYLVPEEFHLPNLSCERLARLQSGFYPRFSRAVFKEALQTFEIDPRTPFDRMSLGGRKKAVIAFALSTLTPVLLLDEPTNGMDIIGRDQFRRLVRRPEQSDRVIVISTHQAHDLEQVISRILFIDQGRLALSSSMESLGRALSMGVVDPGQAGNLPGVLYSEALGAQMAYVATRQDTSGTELVQLELLYRALCRSPRPILQALTALEQQHV